MIKSVYFIAFCAISLSLISCKKDSVTDDTNEACVNNITYLQGGRKFVYENFSPLLGADSIYLEYNTVNTNTVLSTTKTSAPNSVPANSYAQGCGSNIYYGDNSNMVNKQLAFKLNAAVNESWTYTVSANGTPFNFKTTMEAKNISITVKAGTFTCDKFKIEANYVASGIPFSITNYVYINSKYGTIKNQGDSNDYELARANY
jgi:hypothetical protein